MSDHHKLDIAIEFLNDAISKHQSEETPYSALHLAAAAEEIFGAYIRADKDTNDSPSFDEVRAGALRLLGFNDCAKRTKEFKKASKGITDLLNFEKNNIKHGHGSFDSDIRKVTSQTLYRAVENFYKLEERYDLDESDFIKSFRYDQGVEWVREDDEKNK